MRWVAWFVRLLVFVVFLWFALKNTQLVDVAFPGGWFFQDVPLAAALLVAFVTGAVLGLLLLLPALFSRRSEVSRLRRQVETLQLAQTQRQAQAQQHSHPEIAPVQQPLQSAQVVQPSALAHSASTAELPADLSVPKRGDETGLGAA